MVAPSLVRWEPWTSSSPGSTARRVPPCREYATWRFEAAPEAQQGTGYGGPALVLAGRPLLACAVARRHLALYPFSPAEVDAVRDRLDAAQVSKGTVRFSADAPLAADVVRDLVSSRADEINRAARKK